MKYNFGGAVDNTHLQFLIVSYEIISLKYIKSVKWELNYVLILEL